MLAKSIVEMVHGDKALDSVQGSTSAFFQKDIKELLKLSESEFFEHFKSTEMVTASLAERAPTYSSLMVKCGARKTRADARRVVQQGGLQINGETVKSDDTVTTEMLLHQKYMILKSGKKHFSIISFKD